MTISDLLDELASNSGDDSAEFRTQARRWLNLSRSYIADSAMWRSAVGSFTITTASGTRLYSLQGSDSTKYEHLLYDTLYDETNSLTIRPTGLGDIESSDPEKDVTGIPTFWADAGADTSGIRQFLLWPTPSGTYTIRVWAVKQLTDLNEGDETSSTDDYFGAVTPWAATLMSGIKYYQDLDNDEEPNKIVAQLTVFERHIKRRRLSNAVAPTRGLRRAVINQMGLPATGRFDPSHYDNSMR